MHGWTTIDDLTDDPDPQRAYPVYSALHMAPMVRALMLMAAFGYVALVGASAAVATSQLALFWRLLPGVALLLIAAITGRIRQPLLLSLLALSCVLVLEIGINVDAVNLVDGVSWGMPGCLLIPVVLSAMWSRRWDFGAAMALCAFGPLPMLLSHANGDKIYQYLCYMIVAVCLATVLRGFTQSNLSAQFRLERQLRMQANTDGLTGLLQRNCFLERARRELDHVHLQQRPSCMLYLDVDRFKQLNDVCGHAAGDAALIALAECMRQQTRETDLIGRVGGEEFALLLPGVDPQQARIRAEQLRWAVHAIQRPDGPLTVSIGIAESRSADESIEALLARADQALSEAKLDGRDRVVTARRSA